MQQTMRCRRALEETASTPLFSGLPLLLLWRNRAWNFGSEGVISCVTYGSMVLTLTLIGANWRATSAHGMAFGNPWHKRSTGPRTIRRGDFPSSPSKYGPTSTSAGGGTRNGEQGGGQARLKAGRSTRPVGQVAGGWGRATRQSQAVAVDGTRPKPSLSWWGHR